MKICSKIVELVVRAFADGKSDKADLRIPIGRSFRFCGMRIWPPHSSLKFSKNFGAYLRRQSRVEAETKNLTVGFVERKDL
jgi:hypothetical protein